ncbi:MAG: hypothetical protein O3A01_03500 [bacterium]|nr:hypothetical protein [bacterium]
MALNKYTLRRFIALFLVAISVAILVFVITQCPRAKGAAVPLVLPVQEQVYEEIRLVIQPTYFAKSHVAEFSIQMESFQHAETIGMDPISTILLVGSDGAFYLPSKWTSEVNEEFKVHGKLRFEQLPLDLTKLVLKFFVLDELELTWDL